MFAIAFLAQLYHDEIDVAPAEFTVTALRSEVVDFLLPITESHQRIFVKNPAESPNWLAYLEPLSWMAWGVIFLFIAILPLFVAFAMMHGTKENNINYLIQVGF